MGLSIFGVWCRVSGVGLTESITSTSPRACPLAKEDEEEGGREREMPCASSVAAAALSVCFEHVNLVSLVSTWSTNSSGAQPGRKVRQARLQGSSTLVSREREMPCARSVAAAALSVYLGHVNLVSRMSTWSTNSSEAQLERKVRRTRLQGS